MPGQTANEAELDSDGSLTNKEPPSKRRRLLDRCDRSSISSADSHRFHRGEDTTVHEQLTAPEPLQSSPRERQTSAGGQEAPIQNSEQHVATGVEDSIDRLSALSSNDTVQERSKTRRVGRLEEPKRNTRKRKSLILSQERQSNNRNPNGPTQLSSELSESVGGARRMRRPTAKAQANSGKGRHRNPQNSNQTKKTNELQHHSAADGGPTAEKASTSNFRKRRVTKQNAGIEPNSGSQNTRERRITRSRKNRDPNLRSTTDSEVRADDNESSPSRPSKSTRHRTRIAKGDYEIQSERGSENEQEDEEHEGAQLEEDAELEGEKSIDTASKTMAEITRSLRSGKKSQLEAQFREVNWSEVRRKKREALAESRDRLLRPAQEQPMDNQDNENTNDGTAEPDSGGEGGTGPAGGEELAMNEEGEFTLVQTSLNLDQQAQDIAAAEADSMNVAEVTTETDVTQRYNQNSFVGQSRRDPRDREMAALRTPPWTQDETESFYHAVRMCGHDFQLMQPMFLSRTRRHLKLKFNREQREYPERIEAALTTERLPLSLESYAEATGKTSSDYKDPAVLMEELEELKRQQTSEMQEERDQQREQLKLKQEEVARKERKRREKEGNKGKKTKKKKDSAKEKRKSKKGDGGKGSVSGGNEEPVNAAGSEEAATAS